MNFTYPKNEKLKSKIAIGLLFTEGKSVSKYPLRLVYNPGTFGEGEKIKIGVSVSKKYFKKAVDKTTFVCEDGSQIKRCIEEAVESGEGRTIKAKTIGKNKAGEVVAEFFITWSFKAKKEK